MTNLYYKDLETLYTITSDTIMPVSEESTEEVFKARLGDISTAVAFPTYSSVYAYATTNQSIPSGSYKVVAFPAIELDARDEWYQDPLYNRFEPKETGGYYVVIQVSFENQVNNKGDMTLVASKTSTPPTDEQILLYNSDRISANTGVGEYAQDPTVYATGFVKLTVGEALYPHVMLSTYSQNVLAGKTRTAIFIRRVF